jgi:signal peptidase I
MRNRHAKKLLSSGLALIALACVWFYFAPVGLGGSTSYVVTDGISMQPRFHSGDLALVRSRSSYNVGEIVAYNSRAFHTIVLHRIVARAGSRYVFKGDNNNFVDFEHPAQSQLIGALWLHIPGVGAQLESLRSPALIGVLVGVGVLLLGGAAFTQRRRLRRRQRRTGGGTGGGRGEPLSTGHHPQRSPEALFGVLAIGLLALLPFLVLALLAFTRSTTTLAPVHVPYKQSGTLSYSAKTAPGPTYPNERAVTGEPLFTHVLSVVDLSFAYRFHTAAAHSLAGSASLYAKVASTSGWQTTLALGPSQRFRGDRALVTGRLDLTSLLALLRRVQTTTAVSGTYTLTLIPRVRASGSLGALPLHTTFSPRAQFSLTQFEAQPTLPAGGSPAGESSSASAAAPSPANPFDQSTASALTGRRTQPLSLSLGIARVTVANARWIALGGIALILSALLAALAFLRPRPRDESTAILARYRQSIVPVARVWQLPGVGVIDVPEMEGLVRIAEHYDRSILRETTEEGESYWVSDESGQFRYAASAWACAEEEEIVDQSSLNNFMREVYADELKFGAVVLMSERQLAAENAAVEWAAQDAWEAEDTIAAEPASQDAWGGQDTVDAESATQGDWATQDTVELTL